jgi:hypothetical protein
VVCLLGLAGALLGGCELLVEEEAVGGRGALWVGVEVGASLIRYGVPARIVGIELTTFIIIVRRPAASFARLQRGGVTHIGQCHCNLLDALLLLRVSVFCSARARCVGGLGGLTGLCRSGHAGHSLCCCCCCCSVVVMMISSSSSR